MNNNDYTDKVNNLLNDDKTYHKITDKRRNSTLCIEKSLNKLLVQIKLKISQLRITVARTGSTAHFIAPTPHEHHFMAFLKSTRRTSHSDQYYEHHWISHIIQMPR